MYQLIKIQNARTNVPEPMRIPLASATTVERGVPVSIKNGTLTPHSDKSTSLPTHMTLAASNEACVLCYEITREMVFETAVSANPSAMAVGSEYLLTADGKGITPSLVSGSLRGATVISTAGTVSAGDKILVAFR